MPRDLRGLPKNRRCALCPLLPAQEWHHTHSKAYRPTVPARMGWNCVPVSREGHYLIHAVLGGTGKMVIKKGSYFRGRQVGRNIGAIELQNKAGWAGKFPNIFQRLVHAWCRLTFFVFWLLWYGRNSQSWLVRVLAGFLAFQVPGLLTHLQEVWLWQKIFG